MAISIILDDKTATCEFTKAELTDALAKVLAGALTSGKCSDGQCGNPNYWMALLLATAAIRGINPELGKN
jgi:hypothetical protein